MRDVANNDYAGNVTPALLFDPADQQATLVDTIHSSVIALLLALRNHDADEIEQHVQAIESQCAAAAALRHRQRARQVLSATAADSSDELLRSVAEVRQSLQVAKAFLTRLRRANAVMLQVQAVAEGSYSLRDSDRAMRV